DRRRQTRRPVQRRRSGREGISHPMRLSAALTEDSARVAAKSSDRRWSRAIRREAAASSGARRPSAKTTRSSTVSGEPPASRRSARSMTPSAAGSALNRRSPLELVVGEGLHPRHEGWAPAEPAPDLSVGGAVVPPAEQSSLEWPQPVVRDDLGTGGPG